MWLVEGLSELGVKGKSSSSILRMVRVSEITSGDRHAFWSLSLSSFIFLAIAGCNCFRDRKKNGTFLGGSEGWKCISGVLIVS